MRRLCYRTRGRNADEEREIFCGIGWFQPLTWLCCSEEGGGRAHVRGARLFILVPQKFRKHRIVVKSAFSCGKFFIARRKENTSMKHELIFTRHHRSCANKKAAFFTPSSTLLRMHIRVHAWYAPWLLALAIAATPSDVNCLPRCGRREQYMHPGRASSIGPDFK